MSIWTGFEDAPHTLPDPMVSQVVNLNQPTLRDQFALAALTGMMACGTFMKDDSEKAYQVADAMLAAREAK